MRSFPALYCLLAITVASAAARKPLRPARALLAPRFSATDICTKPQETARTIADTLVSGSGMATAESEVRTPPSAAPLSPSPRPLLRRPSPKRGPSAAPN